MFKQTLRSHHIFTILLFAACLDGLIFNQSLQAADLSSVVLQDLEDAEKYYINGKYHLSSTTLKKVDQEQIPKGHEVLQRYFLLQARLSAVYEHDSDMRSWLRRLAENFPDTKLNFYTDPPQILQAWQELSNAQTKKNVDLNTKEQARLAVPEPSVNKASSDEPDLRKQSSSIMSLLPFGIGSYHIGEYSQGILFSLIDLSLVYYGSKGELPFNNLIDTGLEERQGRYTIMASSAFVGSWGYQALLTESARSEGPREEVWFGLSFLPFGVGQLKNGEIGKAFGFGLAQAGLLIIGGNTSNKDLANLCYATVVGSMIYGAYDGWFHHRDPGSQNIGFSVNPVFIPSSKGDTHRTAYYIGSSVRVTF